MAVSDRELVARIAAGDEDAFATLYDGYADRLYRFALVRCRSADLAEEAVQETLLAAWRAAASYRGESSLATWLFGICHHCLSHLLRKVAPEPGPDSQSAIENSARLATDPWPLHETQLVLTEALARLDEGQRTVAFLVYYQGLKLDEVAQALGVPEGTVKSRLYNARRKLAEHLTQKEAAGNAAI